MSSRSNRTTVGHHDVMNPLETWSDLSDSGYGGMCDHLYHTIQQVRNFLVFLIRLIFFSWTKTFWSLVSKKPPHLSLCWSPWCNEPIGDLEWFVWQWVWSHPWPSISDNTTGTQLILFSWSHSSFSLEQSNFGPMSSRSNLTVCWSPWRNEPIGDMEWFVWQWVWSHAWPSVSDNTTGRQLLVFLTLAHSFSF